MAQSEQSIARLIEDTRSGRKLLPSAEAFNYIQRLGEETSIVKRELRRKGFSLFDTIKSLSLEDYKRLSPETKEFVRVLSKMI